MATTTNSEDAEVRFSDQQQINEFGRLNNRLLELRADVKQFTNDCEKLDDSMAELMMFCGGKVMVLIGESFIEVDEDYGTEYCTKKQNQLKARIESMKAEEVHILSRQEVLKKELYARFGDNINLES